MEVYFKGKDLPEEISRIKIVATKINEPDLVDMVLYIKINKNTLFQFATAQIFFLDFDANEIMNVGDQIIDLEHEKLMTHYNLGGFE